MIVTLLTEHHLEFLSLKGGCRGSFESTHVKMPHCWKSHALAHMFCFVFVLVFFKFFNLLEINVVPDQEAAEACSSLHMSKCRIVGNLMHWLICFLFFFCACLFQVLYPP